MSPSISIQIHISMTLASKESFKPYWRKSASDWQRTGMKSGALH